MAVPVNLPVPHTAVPVPVPHMSVPVHAPVPVPHTSVPIHVPHKSAQAPVPHISVPEPVPTYSTPSHLKDSILPSLNIIQVFQNTSSPGVFCFHLLILNLFPSPYYNFPPIPCHPSICHQ